MTSDVASLRQQLSSTESEQNRLCDAEQFEEAEALESTIQQLKDAITRRLEEVAGTSRQMETLARSLLDLTREREGVSERALTRMQLLQTEGEEALSDMDEQARNRLSAESNRLESERKRLELACSHLKKDSDNLEEEKQQLQEAIEQQTNTHETERDKAVAERTAVDDEIRELQKTLEVKLKQRKTLTENVDACEIRISSIKSKFEKQLSRLEGKQKRLEEAQREVDVDEKQVEEIAASLQRERDASRASMARRTEQLSQIRSESRKLRRVRKLMSRHLNMRVRWQKLLEPLQEMVNQARIQWESVTGDCLTLASSLAAKEADTSKLRSQLDAIRIQMPTLEAEKKVAVASRSFKEAGRLAEEIRKCTENQATYEAELEKLQGELTAQREKLAGSRQIEEAAQGELMAAEAKSGAEELRVLQRQICDLDKLRQSSCMSATERILFEEEERVFKSAQTHLAEKYGVALDTLEEIPSDREADDSEEVSEGEEEPPSSPVETSMANQAPPEVAKAPIDVETLMQRREELELIERESSERMNSLDKEIEEACESDQFDKAEELEADRQLAEKALENARTERLAIETDLEEELGPDWKSPPLDGGAQEVELAPAVEEEPAHAVEAEQPSTQEVESKQVDDTVAGEVAAGEVAGNGFSFVTAAPEESTSPTGPDSPADESSSAPAPSGFAFVGGAPADDAPADMAEEADAPCGFAFVGEGPTSAPESGEPASGFSFIGEGGGEAPHPDASGEVATKALPADESEENF
jgi:hypothetical protein